MKFISTRGRAPAVDFRTALFEGLAPDGGLYVPARLEPDLRPPFDGYLAQRVAASEEGVMTRATLTGLLAVALFALYKEHLTGAWRWIFVITAVASLYLNVFVLVVQSFVKVSALSALAPTQTAATASTR